MNITPLGAALPTNVYSQLPDFMQKFEVDNELKLAHFLSQCAHESQNFKAVYENLNYSAKALLNTFPTHFTPTQAATYERKPEMIANRAYANRLGNGDETSGDGWKYRGRGYIQLTGKVNYTAFSRFLAIPEIIINPGLVATIYPLDSAGFFFWNNKVFTIAEAGATDEVVKKVTYKVNGGYNGLKQRTALFHKYYNLLVV